MHHGDTPSIILRRERGEGEGGRETGRSRRKREKDLSHECCVWSSFMVVRLNSCSKGEFRKWRRHGIRRTPAGMLGMATFVLRRYGISRDRGRIAKTALRDVRRVSLENTSFAEGDLISHRKLRASRTLARRTRANDISLLETPKQNGYERIKNI